MILLRYSFQLQQPTLLIGIDQIFWKGENVCVKKKTTLFLRGLQTQYLISLKFDQAVLTKVFKLFAVLYKQVDIVT